MSQAESGKSSHALYKTSRVSVRVTEAEHGEIAARAAASGLPFCEYVRRAALSDSGRPVIRTDPAALKEVYVCLRKAGGLLNQCARELNAGRSPDAIERELREALEGVADASRSVSLFIEEARSSV